MRQVNDVYRRVCWLFDIRLAGKGCGVGVRRRESVRKKTKRGERAERPVLSRAELETEGKGKAQSQHSLSSFPFPLNCCAIHYPNT